MTVTQQTKFYPIIPEYEISSFQNNKSLTSMMFAINTRPQYYDDSETLISLDRSDFKFIASTSKEKF